MRQQENEYTDRISELLDSTLLNLKLVGGNMHPEELQAKEKVTNPSCSYEDTAVTMEKIHGYPHHRVSKR